MNSGFSDIRINRFHWPVTTLGFGKRIGIWMQGCSIGCPGCCSKDTWEHDPRKFVSIDALMDLIRQQPLEAVDGFTISGGEPFEQPEALGALLEEIALLKTSRQDVLVYSGYPFSRHRRHWPHLLTKVDALISEPYKQQRAGAWLRGSDNQRINVLSALGQERYGVEPEEKRPAIQIQFDGDELVMIGIPARGDLEALEGRLKAMGVSWREVSWR